MKKNKIINIISILLILLPLDIIILNIFSNLYLLAYLPMTIGFIIYILNSKPKNLLKKILIIISILCMIISLLSYNSLLNVEGGLDSLGTALGLVIFFRFSRITTKIIAFILLIIDNKEYIFRKKVIISLLSIIIGLTIVYYMYIGIKTSLTTIKVEEDIPSVENFEEELTSRGLITNYSNYKLYGIKKGIEKGVTLSFEEDSTEKFPLYVFVNDITNEEPQYIIYYINGEIYAIKAKYFFSSSQKLGDEEKIIFEFPNTLITETDTITTYNVKKNCFEIGENVTETEYNYYAKNNDTSVFIDLPKIYNDKVSNDEESIKVDENTTINSNSLLGIFRIYKVNRINALLLY